MDLSGLEDLFQTIKENINKDIPSFLIEEILSGSFNLFILSQ